jgi:hypothetical protein
MIMTKLNSGGGIIDTRVRTLISSGPILSRILS